jgi:hypothetical protein
MVEDLFTSKKASQWFTVEEPHADLGCHWHVLAIWDGKFRGSGPRALDIPAEGQWEAVHPNIRK